MKVTETASDLALLIAVLSSLKNVVIPSKWVIFGEVGLAGEIRPVQHGQERLKEAAKHGFTRAIVPKANVGHQSLDMEITGVQTLQEVLTHVFA